MILMIPLNGVIAKKQRDLQVKQMGHKDRRIKMMNEIFNGIKGIKLYAWERPFRELITNTRESELRVLKSSAYLGAAGSFSWNTAPFLVSLVTFITYTKTGNVLTAEKAFVALSLFNLLRFPLAILPMMISALVQASVSLVRLRTFLLLPENADNVLKEGDAGGTTGPIDITSSSETSSIQATESEEDASTPLLINEAPTPAPAPTPAHHGDVAGAVPGGVSIVDGEFAWVKGELPALTDVNIDIKPGTTAAVVGQVGCGKSSLVSALLGDMEKTKGIVVRPSNLAYVPQTAWIQNATVRDNILFGKTFDARRYHKVTARKTSGAWKYCLARRVGIELLQRVTIAGLGGFSCMYWLSSESCGFSCHLPCLIEFLHFDIQRTGQKSHCAPWGEGGGEQQPIVYSLMCISYRSPRWWRHAA